MTRDDFIKASGGVFRSARAWSRWSGREKYRNFWAFFASEGGRSVYAGVDVRGLIRQNEHSIEHVIPRLYLRRALRRAPEDVFNGSTVNPFNLAVCHRSVNKARGSAWFEFDPQVSYEAVHIDLKGGDLKRTGLSVGEHWVVPPRTRGDVARAILYMCLVYDLRGPSPSDLGHLYDWARADAPSLSEVAFNAWVFTHRGIRNPFIHRGDEGRDLLNDETLRRAFR